MHTQHHGCAPPFKFEIGKEDEALRLKAALDQGPWTQKTYLDRPGNRPILRRKYPSGHYIEYAHYTLFRAWQGNYNVYYEEHRSAGVLHGSPAIKSECFEGNKGRFSRTESYKNGQQHGPVDWMWNQDNQHKVKNKRYLLGMLTKSTTCKPKSTIRKYYKNGKLHREGGPAIERTSGDAHYKAWFINGELDHTKAGPLYYHVPGRKSCSVAQMKTGGRAVFFTKGSYLCRILGPSVCTYYKEDTANIAKYKASKRSFTFSPWEYPLYVVGLREYFNHRDRTLIYSERVKKLLSTLLPTPIAREIDGCLAAIMADIPPQ